MLSYFSVTNFKNFKDEYVFDLSEVRDFQFNPEGVENGVVKKAIIYGYNGIGKSNLALAIFDVVLHVSDNFKPSGMTTK